MQGPNGKHWCYVSDPAGATCTPPPTVTFFTWKWLEHYVLVWFSPLLTFILADSSTEVSRPTPKPVLWLASLIDIRLGNILVKLPSSFYQQSIAEFRETYGEAEDEAITRVDGKPLPPNIPTKAVYPLYLGKKTADYTLEDAQNLLLADFGEAWAPAQEGRLGKDSHIPAGMQPPEAHFEPTTPLSFPSDIWSLATALWEIMAMKFIFPNEWVTIDEVFAYSIDLLGAGSFPPNWRQAWDQKDQYFEILDSRSAAASPTASHPLDRRSKWPPLDNAWEEFVQKYRRKSDVHGLFGEEESRAILDLMQKMLRFRPEERLTIGEVLKSEWMVKWALPTLKKGDEKRSSQSV